MVWPSIETYNVVEVKETLHVLSDSIRNYNVAKLFIDGSQTSISPDLDQQEHKTILMDFARAVANTRLLKWARLVTPSKAREDKAKRVEAEIKNNDQLVIQSQEFNSKEEAVSWLLS